MTSNKEIRDQFLAVAKERGLKPSTVYRYRRWIRKFLQYHHGIALESVELEEVDDFLDSLSDLSESTKHQAKNALSFIFEVVIKKKLNSSLKRPKRHNYFTWISRWMLK